MLKKIDNDFLCPISYQTPDDLFRYFFEVWNGIPYIETDRNGSQIQDATGFFAINRILSFSPVPSNNKFSKVNYNCLLTIATPSDDRQEIETLDRIGQYDEIIKLMANLEWINIFRSYFLCCDFEIENLNFVPVYNVNTNALAINYTGLEITFNLTI